MDTVKLMRASPSREQPVFMNEKTRGKAAVLVYMCNPKSFLTRKREDHEVAWAITEKRGSAWGT